MVRSNWVKGGRHCSSAATIVRTVRLRFGICDLGFPLFDSSSRLQRDPYRSYFSWLTHRTDRAAVYLPVERPRVTGPDAHVTDARQRDALAGLQRSVHSSFAVDDCRDPGRADGLERDIDARRRPWSDWRRGAFYRRCRGRNACPTSSDRRGNGGRFAISSDNPSAAGDDDGSDDGVAENGA